MHPKPVGRVTAHGGLQRRVHILHDRLAGPRAAVRACFDLCADFQPPLRQADAMADDGKQIAIIPQRQHGGGEIRMTRVAQKRALPAARMLIHQQTDDHPTAVQQLPQPRSLRPPLKEAAAILPAQTLQQAVRPLGL